MTTESLEVVMARQYLLSTGVPYRITSTWNHKKRTSAGFLSYHVRKGTDGIGLALDIAGPTSGMDTEALGLIFWAFEPVFNLLHELIYAGPQTSFNIRDGKRVDKFAQADHHDHVHCSFKKGVFLRKMVDEMAIFKDVVDEQRAYVRMLYRDILKKKLPSFDEQEMRRAQLIENGADWLIAELLDSPEGTGILLRERKALGIDG